MDTLEQENSKQLADLIIRNGTPDKDAETQLMPYNLEASGLGRRHMEELLADLTARATKSSNIGDITAHRKNIQSIMIGAIAAAFNYKWLAISTRSNNHTKEYTLGQLNFSRRRLERILPVLIEDGWLIAGRKGFLSNSARTPSKSSQYFAGERLIRYFCDSLYRFSVPLELESYHRFNDFPQGSTPDSSVFCVDDELLRLYNRFMQDHSWAMKGPTVRTFSESMDRGGRLHTNFQNIVNRRIPIRRSTLLSGKRIVEPDFSCNHLRMAAALVGEELPEDPYAELIAAVGKDPTLHRNHAKAFITRCIGAISLKQKGGLMQTAAKGNGHGIKIETELFRELLATTDKLFPWVKQKNIFFNDVGAKMQKLEGEIGLGMLRWAINEKKPLLLVHDSCAVREQDGKETKEQMQEEWAKVIEKRKEQKEL